ncbi:AAA family ATPase [Oxalobacteraceae bacterium A2-2]
MRIHRIHIKNYRCFDDLEVEFDPQLTVIVALNGQGKTSLLDAIKVAIWPFVAGFDLGSTTNDITGIHIDDVRRERQREHEMEWRLPSFVEGKGIIDARHLREDGRLSADMPADTLWSMRRYRDSVKKNTKTKTAGVEGSLSLEACAAAFEERIFSDRTAAPDDLPMLGYYGTGRLWSQKKLTGVAGQSEREAFSRTFAYRDCLDPASSYKHFAQWFTLAFKALRDAQIRQLEQRNPVNEAIPEGLLAPIKAIQNAIDSVLEKHTGWRRLEYSAEHQELVQEHPEYGWLKVSQLSDGIRNMLALVGDIAYRCYKLNAHHGEDAPILTRGIVLIDEVDMHLHPEWQQTVLPDLRSAFPLLQFIVTTHSPQVITTVAAQSIRRLVHEFDEDLQRHTTVIRPVTQQTLGIASSDALAEVMGIDPVPDVEAVRELNEYHSLIQQNLHDSKRGQELLSRLVRHFGAGHPLMLNCQRLIRFQQFKQQLPMKKANNA